MMQFSRFINWTVSRVDVRVREQRPNPDRNLLSIERSRNLWCRRQIKHCSRTLSLASELQKTEGRCSFKGRWGRFVLHTASTEDSRPFITPVLSSSVKPVKHLWPDCDERSRLHWISIHKLVIQFQSWFN